MSAPDIVKIRARIRALLAKTVDAGCTEAEAETAAARARELLREHGLTEEGVLGFEIMEYRVRVTKARAETDCLMGAIARICHCECWFSVGDIREAVYFGHEPDTLIAEYMHGVVYGAVDRARTDFRQSKDYTRRRTTKTRNAAMKAFTKGFVDGLWRKLYYSQTPDAARLGRVQTALARREMAFTAGRPKKEKKIGAAFQGALERGRQQGRAVQITPGMSGAEPTRQIGYRGGAE